MNFLKKLLVTALVLGCIGFAAGWYIGLRSNTVQPGEDPFELKIFEGDDFEKVVQTLESAGVLKSASTFQLVAKVLKYPDLVKPGRYLIEGGWDNLKLVRKLRSGDQDETRISFISRRTLEDVVESVTENVMADKDTFMALLKDETFLAEQGFNPQTIIGMFIPNTYNTFWTVDERELFDRMKAAYDNFWTDERKAKAKALDLTPKQVSALASIVQAETQVVSERPTVAGLYLNRLNQGMLLQADPTVIFAVGDFTIKRVLNKHLEFESPYNTYLNPGLPPGPINCPDISSIDAVLNYEHHDYIYMCAKCDLSGHNFAKTLSQHNRNAREYRACLAKMNLN